MGKEVYSNAPLAWVTAEVRYPQSPRLHQRETLDKIQLALEDLLPIVREEQLLTLQVGPQGPGPEHERACRLLNRQSTQSVVVSPRTLTVETSAYDRFERFLTLIDRAVTALFQIVPIAAVERVGIRYINEIRLPADIKDSAEWAEWIDPTLVGSALFHRAYPSPLFQGSVHYVLGERRQLAFRYGALPGGSVIGPSAMIRAEVDRRHPLFVLDFDSFWQAENTEVTLEPDAGSVRAIFEDLHQPVSDVFEAALTDRLRQLFRGETNS